MRATLLDEDRKRRATSSRPSDRLERGHGGSDVSAAAATKLMPLVRETGSTALAQVGAIVAKLRDIVWLTVDPRRMPSCADLTLIQFQGEDCTLRGLPMNKAGCAP